MTVPNLQKIINTRMSEVDFKRLSNFIYDNFGIKMPPAKRTMLQSRLHKRLRALNIDSFSKYIDYLFSKEGSVVEVIQMIDVVSTNKTDFFREPTHFDFMSEKLIPSILQQRRVMTPLKIWSAGCSTGEEPYTLAMVMTEIATRNQNLDFSIFATDISTRALKQGVSAIYKDDRIAHISIGYKKKYFLRSKDRDKQTVRLIPQLRKKIAFQRLNFMDSSYNVADSFDIIFCRNVLIYFDRETQESVINKLCQKLKSGGYFFLGHSESITNMRVPLRQVQPTIFVKI